MKLKNYKSYLKKIKAYAKLCNVSIVFKKEVDGTGEYRPSRREVVIEKGLPQSAILSTLLHELGHFVDDLTNPSNHFSNRFHNDGRTAIENDRDLTMLQKKRILKLEKEAWKNARALARQLNIPIGSWFTKDEKSSLNSYYSIRIRKD
jgi:hypothetical protein